MTAIAPWMQNWQSAYPYIANKSTGIKLGDYEDAKNKFMTGWGTANPYTGATQTALDPWQLVSGSSPTSEDHAAKAEWEAYDNDKNQAFFSQLTPEQKAEYFSQKEDKYNSQKRMGQMAFLAAAGAMAAPGIMGAMGAQGGATTAGAYGAGSGWGADTLTAMGLSGAGGTGAATGGAAAAAGMGEGLMGLGTEGAGMLSGGYGGAMGAGVEGAGALTGAGTVAAGGAGSAASSWASGPFGDFLKSLGTKAGGSLLSQLISAGGNAYMGNKQTGQYNDIINQINQLYSPDSPYAKQMQQAMERKDAAAGRNSQYGTRGVELAAALTNSKAQALTSPGFTNLLMQRGINQNMPMNGFLAALGSGAGQDLITKAGGAASDWLSKLFGNSGNSVSPTTPNGGSSWMPDWSAWVDGG
jgi:hypothetical protein